MKLNKRHLGLNRKYYFNQKCFEIIDNEYKAYWLGMLAADGHVRVRKTGNSFCLTSIDKEHLEKYKGFLNHSGEIKLHHGNCYRFEVCSNKVVNDLITLGIVPRKSFCTSIPNISSVFIRDFIRGVFDGDGTIGFYGNSWRLSITSATKFFIYNIKSIINEFGIFGGSIYHRDNVYTLSFGGNQVAYSFGQFLYNNSNIYLNRKYKKYIELCDYIDNPLMMDIIKKFKYCTASGCNKVLYAKDLCRRHYDRKRHSRGRT